LVGGSGTEKKKISLYQVAFLLIILFTRKYVLQIIFYSELLLAEIYSIIALNLMCTTGHGKASSLINICFWQWIRDFLCEKAFYFSISFFSDSE
jgi:hypothetical protein